MLLSEYPLLGHSVKRYVGWRKVSQIRLSFAKLFQNGDKFPANYVQAYMSSNRTYFPNLS